MRKGIPEDAMHTRQPDPLTSSQPPATNAFDQAITRALAQAPHAPVPDGFAVLVAQRAAAQPQPRRMPWLGWGPRLALGSGAVLTLALFALAPHTTPTLTSVRFDAELILFAELGALLLCAPQLLRE